MHRRLLLIALLFPLVALCQTELPGSKMMNQFTHRGAEITGENKKNFFDWDTNAVPEGWYRAESAPVPFGKGHLLIASIWQPDRKIGVRKYFFFMVHNGYLGRTTIITTDDKDAAYDYVANDLLIFSTIEKGEAKRRVLTVVEGRIEEAKFRVPVAQYPLLANKVFEKSTFKIPDDESKLMFMDRQWGTLKVKKLLADSSITPREADMLQLMIRNAPYTHGYVRYTKLAPSITVKGTRYSREDYRFEFWDLVKIETSIRGYDSCVVNMDGIPINGGNIIGLTRTNFLDKGPKVAYSFAWFDGTMIGTILNFESDSRSIKQPYPNVTMIADRIIKIASHDGAGKEKTHFAAISDHDLFLLSDLPKDEVPFLRNYIYARYGYKFKNPVYQNYFSLFDWYKPEHDDAEKVSKLMTADEREIVAQLAAAEKIPVGK